MCIPYLGVLEGMVEIGVELVKFRSLGFFCRENRFTGSAEPVNLFSGQARKPVFRFWDFGLPVFAGFLKNQFFQPSSISVP